MEQIQEKAKAPKTGKMNVEFKPLNFSNNDVRVATITLWVLVTSRADLFMNKEPRDFVAPNPLVGELLEVSQMVVDETGQPDEAWVDRVRSVCQSAVKDPLNPDAHAGFNSARAVFQQYCIDAWTGLAGQHPGLQEFTVTMNN